MASNLTVYSYLDVAAYIAGVLVDGLWEGDDAVVIEPNSEIGSAIVGADGSPLVSITADRAANITIRLQPTSSMHKLLLKKYDDMQRNIFQPFPVSVMDVRNGDGGAARQCVIIARPNDQFGENATVREWRLFAGEWVPKKQNFA